MSELVYKPGGQVLKDFLRDDHFFRGLRGPVGSGKSAACCIEVFRRACLQKPGPDGIRRFKCAVIRNSYPQLATTTLETWLQWFPEEVWGPVKMHPPPFEHHMKKGDLELTVLFLALDRPDDVKKLLSLELTMVWINEARELPKSIVDACTMRVGRYPSMKDGGPSWYGVIADTNAPDEDHWWPIMAGEAPLPDHITREDALTLVKPDSWRFFKQPGGMRAIMNCDKEVTGYELNPLAENLQNLTPDYYPRIIQGKGRDWIKVYVLNEFATLTDGKPVYADFDEAMHVAKEPIQPIPNLPLTIGVDFGLTPSAVIAQKIRHRWLVLHEIVATDMGIVRFAELLKSDLAQRFPGHKATIWGDPSGDFRAATDETTPFQILRRAGLIARPAPTNDPALRIEAVTGTLTRLVDKQPGMLIDPRCTVLIRGYKSGYHYKRVQKTGSETFDSKPNKNQFSHVHDANQYLVCGGGESREILVGGNAATPVVARRDFDVFNRPKAERKRPAGGRFGAL